MTKLVLPPISSGYLSAEALNQRLEAIQNWSDTVVSRDGSIPNHLTADLDLNGRTLLNIGQSASTAALVTVGQMQDFVESKSSGLIRQQVESFTATAGQTLFTLTTFTYEPNVGNLAVYKNGTRIFAGFDYTETNSSSLTLASGAGLGDKIRVVSNEFLATIALPQHQHYWDQIIGPPVYALRWPTYAEVTDKPASFTPSAHVHATTDITSGVSFPDGFRGVFVQASQPTATRVGDLWFN